MRFGVGRLPAARQGMTNFLTSGRTSPMVFDGTRDMERVCAAPDDAPRWVRAAAENVYRLRTLPANLQIYRAPADLGARHRNRPDASGSRGELRLENACSALRLRQASFAAGNVRRTYLSRCGDLTSKPRLRRRSLSGPSPIHHDMLFAYERLLCANSGRSPLRPRICLSRLNCAGSAVPNSLLQPRPGNCRP